MKSYEELFTAEEVKDIADRGLSVPKKDEMTCSSCSDVTICEFAWDLYNTQGDCLAMK